MSCPNYNIPYNDYVVTLTGYGTCFGVAVDSGGNVYFADNYNNIILKITPSGVLSTLAGTSGTAGYVDGQGTAAKFNKPYGVAVDSGGNVYVADTVNNRIRKITPSGLVSTLAGSGTEGYADGQGTAAKFNKPYGVAVDSSGNVYVADTFNHRIRKITSTGLVTNFAGNGIDGYVDGTIGIAQIIGPYGVAVGPNGNIYVSSTNAIRMIYNGSVYTVAGANLAGYVDDVNAVDARFSQPFGIAVDSGGNIYVADPGNNRIRKIGFTISNDSSLQLTVKTLAGSSFGYADGQGTAAKFNQPYGVAVDSSGNVYVADSGNNRFRKINKTTCRPICQSISRQIAKASGGTVNTTLTSPYSFSFFDLTSRIVYCPNS
jgi:streptogramin lyase